MSDNLFSIPYYVTLKDLIECPVKETATGLRVIVSIETICEVTLKTMLLSNWLPGLYVNVNLMSPCVDHRFGRLLKTEKVILSRCLSLKQLRSLHNKRWDRLSNWRVFFLERFCPVQNAGSHDCKGDGCPVSFPEFPKPWVNSVYQIGSFFPGLLERCLSQVISQILNIILRGKRFPSPLIESPPQGREGELSLCPNDR